MAVPKNSPYVGDPMILGAHGVLLIFGSFHISLTWCRKEQFNLPRVAS